MISDCYTYAKKMLDQGFIKAAEEAFKNGVQNGDVKCFYGLVAVAAITGTDMESPIDKLRCVLPDIMKSCVNNDPDACFIIGRCYELGLGVAPNLCSAMYYYEKAATMGSPDAMYNMGCIYMSSAPCGVEMALSWFHKAADCGLPNAYRALSH